MSTHPDHTGSGGDTELLAAIAEGDLEAFGTLYDRHAAWLLRLRRRAADPRSGRPDPPGHLSGGGSIPTRHQELKQELAHVVEGLMDVLENLREISRGIHPAILSERGLGPAIKALARRSPVPVELEMCLEDRFPDPVEIGAYYVVSEALANVAKHAKAKLVRVSVDLRHGFLAVSIQDDGVGGADANGSGLTGLAERVEALGGAMQLVSPPGGGTVIDVELPIEAA